MYAMLFWTDEQAKNIWQLILWPTFHGLPPPPPVADLQVTEVMNSIFLFNRQLLKLKCVMNGIYLSPSGNSIWINNVNCLTYWYMKCSSYLDQITQWRTFIEYYLCDINTGLNLYDSLHYDLCECFHKRAYIMPVNGKLHNITRNAIRWSNMYCGSQPGWEVWMPCKCMIHKGAHS